MTKKNVILITVDCLRADHLGCMGYPKIVTPTLDSLAGKGVLFSSAFSVGPVTPVSFISMFTSTYPLMYRGYATISEERTTIAEILKENGYRTAAFHSNAFLSRFYHFDRGFETFYDGFDLGIRDKKKIITVLKKSTWLFNVLKNIYFTLKTDQQPYTAADKITEKVLSWTQKCSGNFFLWVHYMDVHVPYNPPQKYMTRPIRQKEIRILHKKIFNCLPVSDPELEKIIDLYDAEIRYVDWVIGSLLESIGEKILKDTYVIITSDHGDEFGEHGGFLHAPKLYDELIHVPLILVGPGLKKGSINCPVSLLDLAPTILDLLGIKAPQSFHGTSLLPLVKGKDVKTGGVISEVSHQDKKEVVFDIKKRQVSYRTAKWKYIYRKNSCELYDLENDPLETRNVVTQEPEKAEELKLTVVGHMQMEDMLRERITEEMRIKEKIEDLKARGRI